MLVLQSESSNNVFDVERRRVVNSWYMYFKGIVRNTIMKYLHVCFEISNDVGEGEEEEVSDTKKWGKARRIWVMKVSLDSCVRARI